MKKFIYIASIVALGLASCSDEFEPNSGQSGVQGISTAYVNVPNVGGVSTRTSLNGLNYYWSNGDAIGVYAADPTKGGNVENSPFVFSKSNDGVAEFAGQIYLNKDAQYYAYYPYSASQELSDDELTMVISPKQSFNALACQPVATSDYNWDYSNGMYGSFANNTAPMVASSTATSKTEIVFDDMEALGAYIVMPVTGYTSTPIQTATLTIQGGDSGEEEQVIAGSFTVDLTDISAAYEVEALENDENDGKQIALNMGAGLDLVPGYITNLWFVVPAGISVKTVSVVFDDDDTHPISRTFKNTNTTVANQPVFVPQDKNTPFEYVQGDGALIATPAQFLEYANLVTMGYPAIQAYNNLNITGEDSPYAAYTEYAQLPQMITLAEGTNSIADVTSAENYTVKDALIVADLEFSGLAAILKEDLGALGSGVFANPEAQYFLDVYGGYLDATNPGIKPIGGQASYVIQGSGYSINNLTVVGNGMFNRNTGDTYKASINNLTISGLTVNASQVNAPDNNYYLLAQNYNTGQQKDPTFTGVTVEESTITTPAGENINKAIFNTVWASNFNPETLGVENESTETIPAFANNLMLNQNFDFTAEGYGIDNFNTITVYGQALANPVCTVADQTNAIKLMDKVLNPSNFGYSVVDATTSYWTGTKTLDGTGMYAEDLAWVVQNATSGQTFTFGTYDLNLMGTYTNSEGKEVHQYWWAMGNNTPNSGFTKTVNGSKTNFTISNVYINGTTDGTTAAANKDNFTLIGRGSIVNNVVVDGITIENVGENANPDALIAAISILPTDGTNIVTVNNMTVNASVASNSAVGGLYVQLQQNWFGRINEATFTWATNGTPSAPLSYGSVAGTAQLQVSGGSTAATIGSVIPSTTTTLDAPKPYFGSATVVISSDSNNAQTVYVDLSALDIAQPQKGSNKLGNITITPGSGLSDGATVNVLSSENVYYQFTYYTSTNTLSYVGNLGAN
ncbi:MAG: hypothetical protein J1E82_09775 [Muribaculaceae bacterium]|nr:hypothetical protein [Muribaculaceae bacterium]